MSAEIMEKASELAEAIAESRELAQMRDAELTMNADPTAVSIIEEFQEKQKAVHNKQMRGEELDEQDKKDIARIEDKMSSHPAIRAYIEASEKFEYLMRSVNLVIARAISGGEQGCGCGSACGPECGADCGSYN